MPARVVSLMHDNAWQHRSRDTMIELSMLPRCDVSPITKSIEIPHDAYDIG